jgi:hypothetical protein
MGDEAIQLTGNRQPATGNRQLATGSWQLPAGLAREPGGAGLVAEQQGEEVSR